MLLNSAFFGSLEFYPDTTMNQLKTISNNHISLRCRCDHSKLVSVQELFGRLSPTTSIYEVAIKAKCSHCGTKGVVDFWLHYVCKTKGY